jgi:PAS domain S-box-containing protein
MSEAVTAGNDLMLRIHDLTLQLEEAEDTLRALRHGEVDAIVVKADAEEQIYTLKGADHAYRVLFETLNEGALTLGLEGTVLWANSCFAQFVGLPLEQVVGAPFESFLSPADRERFLALHEAGRKGNSKTEASLVHASGSLVPVMVSLSAVYLAGIGETCTAVVTDLTELRQAQEALQQANTELEARVAARTAELTRLNQALANADQRKDRFLAMLAHELRNPLGPIRNAIELLKRWGPPDPRLVRARGIIDRQVKHQARLLDDLLDVSRIAQGKIRIHSSRLNLAQLIRDAAEDCRGIAEESGLSLCLELPDEPVWVDGDAIRLAQVVTNLLQNAAKFSNAGGRVVLSLSTEPQNGMARVKVRDTGIGIEREMLPRLFESFSQADSSLDRSRDGLGLGLALVKGIVELHQGCVSAHSDGPGHGAEFSFLLPLAAAGATEALDAPSPMGAQTRPLRILIVEDNRDSADSLRELLELAGYRVEVAYSGQAALAITSEFQPEVVLCDLGLPGMTGYEVVGALRQNPSLATARMVAVSGYGQEEDKTRSRTAGFDAHLTKPVEFEELQRLLQIPSGGQG